MCSDFAISLRNMVSKWCLCFFSSVYAIWIHQCCFQGWGWASSFESIKTSGHHCTSTITSSVHYWFEKPTTQYCHLTLFNIFPQNIDCCNPNWSAAKLSSNSDPDPKRSNHEIILFIYIYLLRIFWGNK